MASGVFGSVERKAVDKGVMKVSGICEAKVDHQHGDEVLVIGRVVVGDHKMHHDGRGWEKQMFTKVVIVRPAPEELVDACSQFLDEELAKEQPEPEPGE